MITFDENNIFDKLPENIVIEKALDNNDTMKITKNDKAIYVHSSYYPIEMSNIFVDSFMENEDFKRTKLIILFGLGLGYELNRLISQIEELNSEIMLLVLEPESSVLAYYLKNNDYLKNTNLDIRFFTGEEIYDKEKYSNLMTHKFEKVKLLKLHSYMEIYEYEYIEVFSNIKYSLIDGKLNKNTILKVKDLWAKNEIASLKHFFETPSIQCIEKLIKNKPAIIVSAGPSLNKNIEILKEAKDKYFIIAVYTAYITLQNAGIEPDMIASMDAHQLLYDEHVDGIDVPCLFSTKANDLLKNKNKHVYNNLMFVRRDFRDMYIPEKYHDRLIMSDNFFGTVASMVFDFLVQQGANPIIFVGQDLSYTEDGTTHAAGTYYDKNTKLANQDDNKLIEINKKLLNQGNLYVKGNYTEKVKTDAMMYSFLQWFNFAIPKFSAEKDITFINATEGGAFITGTEVMTLKEVLEKYPSNDGISSRFSEALKDNFVFKNKDEMKEMYDYIFSINNDLNEIVEITEKADKISSELKELFKYTNFPKQGKVNKLVKILDEQDAKLEKMRESFTLLESAYTHNFYELEEYEFDERLNETQKIVEKDAFFHHSINVTVKTLKKCFEELIDYLNKTYKFDIAE